jgi:acetylornithine deacetylase/succinyl-diaminopimelate desuccinylase-like protein
MLDAVFRHLEEHRDEALERLKQFLNIPSVSTDAAFAPKVREAAQWVANEMREIGLEVRLHETSGHPLVVGSNAGASPAAALYYGHYDVQPPDPQEAWESPPFEATVRGGAVYARGASDDKGQVCCILEAMRAWRQVHGCLPLSVTVLIEGEEECGSAGLPDFVTAHADTLRCRSGGGPGVVVISDTTMWETSQGPAVSITYGLRGMLYYDIQLHGPNRDLHSGMYGGTLANPATMLTSVLGRLFDEGHRVTIPGFYDDVVPLSDDERQRWNRLQFDERAFLDNVGASTGFGEEGFELLERRWARPACDINGLYGGYGGEGAKTIIPAFAGAKVSFRLAPNQDPDRIAAALESWLRGQDVHGCRWKLRRFSDAYPALVSTDSPHVAAAGRAVVRAAGRDPVLVREGATIPIVADFKKTLDLDSLLIGFGRMDDCIHAPNEKFDLECFELGCRTHAALLAELPK